MDRDSITLDENKTLYYARCAADLSNPEINKAEVMYMTAFGKQLPSKEETDMYNAAVQMSNKNMPPTFLWSTTEDKLVNAKHTMLLVEALDRNNVPYEVHIFKSGPHGLSLATEQTSNFENQTVPHVAKWFDLSVEWLKEIF
jgi:dipeptidyl aminopeptidase/acylaminoacyl peptidase